MSNSIEIDDHVFDMGLSVYAFRLYGHLKRLAANGDYYTPGVRDLSRDCKMSIDSVMAAKKDLVSAGLLFEADAVSPTDAMEIISQKYPQQWTYKLKGGRRCEWCLCTTTSLHAHHYPISKADGGTDTVNICPNCHAEYHDLTRQRFTL